MQMTSAATTQEILKPVWFGLSAVCFDSYLSSMFTEIRTWSKKKKIFKKLLKKSLMIDLHQFYKLWISILAADFIKWTSAVLVLFCYLELSRQRAFTELRQWEDQDYQRREREKLRDHIQAEKEQSSVTESPAYSATNKFKKEALMYTKTLLAPWPLEKRQITSPAYHRIKKIKHIFHFWFKLFDISDSNTKNCSFNTPL